MYKTLRGPAPDNEYLKKILSRYNFEVSENIREEVIRKAKRAYPDYILLDVDLWAKIEEDDIANLALSPEEELLLESATFPMFINGQAGSGKSTMLFYLFAHFCNLINSSEHNIIFLTYSRKLLEIAKKNVITILKNNRNYIGTFSKKESELKYIESYFRPFQEFIISDLLTRDERKIFTKEKYISFNQFRQGFLGINIKQELNCLLPNRKNFSPELVWHVIRTYIKGYDFERYLLPEDYRKLNRRDLTVSYEKYCEIFQTIWERWYKNLYEEFGYWDDQDLIRYVLRDKNFDELKKYAVIFCDESQDFTKIEIDFLIKLSVYIKYNLSYHHNLPCVFAGDPFQTINPTGFRWETVKTMFLERFEKLNPKGISLRFETLNYNYRSKPAIIKFLNFVQAFRYKYLNLQELRPQIPWQREEGVSPCIFTLNNNIVERMKEIADKTIIIIPTDGDEIQEKDFVKGDEILSSFIEINENNDAPISNVMSASTSKGLEFDKVILYKFGTTVPKSFINILNGMDLDDNSYIELSHFLNKLYVAVSRARNFLFIIDTDEAYKNFWSYFTNIDILKSLFDNKGRWDEKLVLPLVKGLPQDIDNIKEENPLKVAQELEQTGLNQGDYFLLQRAKQYYKLINKENDALRCEAWAFWYRENWHKAGLAFQELGFKDKALECFWRNANWKDIIDISETDNVYKLISEYMLNIKNLDNILNSEQFWEKCDVSSYTWNIVINKIQNDLSQTLYEQKPYLNSYSLYARRAERIALLGFPQFYLLSAEFWFKEKNYKKAVELWDKSDKTDHRDYFYAKYMLANNDIEKIKWLNKLKKDDEIVKIYKENHQSYDSETNNIILSALLKVNDYEKALKKEDISLNIRILKILESITN